MARATEALAGVTGTAWDGGATGDGAEAIAVAGGNAGLGADAAAEAATAAPEDGGVLFWKARDPAPMAASASIAPIQLRAFRGGVFVAAATFTGVSKGRVATVSIFTGASLSG